AALYADDPILESIAIRALVPSLDRPELAIALLSRLYKSELDPWTRELVANGFRRYHGGVPTMVQAESRLAETVIASLASRGSVDEPESGSEGPHSIWVWDAPTGTATERAASADTVRYLKAAHRAEDLLQISPDHEPYHELYLASVLATAQSRIGWSRSISRDAPSIASFARTAPRKRLDGVLSWSLRHRCLPAAIAACQIWAVPADADRNPASSMLGRALRDPSERIRMEALMAIMRTEPIATGAPEFDVWKAAQRLAATSGERRLLIVDPNPVRGSRLAGLCRQVGYASESTPNPRTALRWLSSSPDFEFVLIQEELGRPRWTELFQQLRHDWLTAELPTAILYDVDSPLRMPETVSLDHVIHFPGPRDEPSLRALLAWLASQREHPVTVTERGTWAAAARSWLSRNRSTSLIDPDAPPLQSRQTAAR
ncbi:MAG TPA: hypothetical protein VIY86_06325, partial [Pirellulaceae bacterium]